MPRAASSSESEKMALVAPRILKEPVFCRFSHLKNRRPPVSLSRDAEVNTGVRCIRAAMRLWASRIASQVKWEYAEVLPGMVALMGPPGVTAIRIMAQQGPLAAAGAGRK